MTRTVLDTSVLVRYFTGDDAGKTAAVGKLLGEAPPGSLLFPDVAVAELGFVLLRVYGYSPQSVAGALRAIATHPAIEVHAPTIWLDVADDLGAGRGLVDAYLMRSASAVGAPTLFTFDRKLKPLAGVRCREP